MSRLTILLCFALSGSAEICSAWASSRPLRCCLDGRDTVEDIGSRDLAQQSLNAVGPEFSLRSRVLVEAKRDPGVRKARARTWCLDETRDLSVAVEVVFRLRTRIADRGEEYRSRFGVVPEFRAALHAGPVVAGEMGDSKLEIVLLGDTVNTTARIGQACRELDRAFLVSAEALALIELPSGTESERMPPAALKGKSRQVRLYAVDRAAPDERDGRRQRTQRHS